MIEWFFSLADVWQLVVFIIGWYIMFRVGGILVDKLMGKETKVEKKLREERLEREWQRKEWERRNYE